jgi:hypothetical protein
MCVVLQALRTITTIKTSGARLLNLINDILDAASMRKVCVSRVMLFMLVVVWGANLFICSAGGQGAGT